jgi:hypothetical protein
MSNPNIPINPYDSFTFESFVAMIDKLKTKRPVGEDFVHQISSTFYCKFYGRDFDRKCMIYVVYDINNVIDPIMYIYLFDNNKIEYKFILNDPRIYIGTIDTIDTERDVFNNDKEVTSQFLARQRARKALAEREAAEREAAAAKRKAEEREVAAVEEVVKALEALKAQAAQVPVVKAKKGCRGNGCALMGGRRRTIKHKLNKRKSRKAKRSRKA